MGRARSAAGERALLGGLLALVVVASCSQPRPDFGLSIAGTEIASREAICNDTGGCGAGACPPPVAPLTVVRAAPPIKLDFTADGDVTEIGGSVWLGDTMAVAAIETFMLPAGVRSWTSKSMAVYGRYYLNVSAQWSRQSDRGFRGRVFLVEIVPP
jgi:hypothetical protein